MENHSARLDPERLLAESGWIRALAQGLVGPSDVDDVVQETWRVALERPPRLNGPDTNLRGWLAAVMHNLVESLRRGARVRADHVADMRREPAPSESDTHERMLLHRHLVDAVLELEEPHKSAIVYRYFDGLTPREIAVKQSVSYDAARQRLSRGLAMLRARLDREYDGGRAMWGALCVGLVRGKVALASPVGVVGGIIVGVKSVFVVAGLVLAAASLLWWRGARFGSSDASTIGARPADELASSARDASDAPNTERRATSAGEQVIDRHRDLHDARAQPAAKAVDASFEPRLDVIAATFLTEQPDFRGLAAVWDEVAASAQLVPESVKQADTLVSGELSIPGSSVRAKFEISNDSYRVSFDKLQEQGSERPYFQRTVTLAFQSNAGVAMPGSSIVQFHPDTRRSVAGVLSPGEERLIGWTVFQHDARVMARPLTVRAGPDGTSWAVGYSASRADLEAVYGVDGRAEQSLLELLAKTSRH